MTLDDVLALDAADPLSGKRQAFVLPEGTINLDGNSLGCLPRAARQRAREVIDRQWGQDLITSWNRHQWIRLPQRTGERIARLLGAAPGQVICCDSVTINLFKLLGAALSLRPERSVVLAQAESFPTDLYAVQGLQQLLGTERCRLQTVPEERVEAALNDDVAVVLLSQVNFRTGRIHDIETLTRLAHERGIPVIWDLSHSTGVIPLELDGWEVDFAVGCGYKYLNGGPGAPAFLYAAQRHHSCLQQPLSGWMGHAAPFDFDPDYRPAAGIDRFLTGTPPILSMSVLDAALDVMEDCTMHQLRDKSLSLSELLLQLHSERSALHCLEPASPLDPAQRGGQLAFSHPEAYAICQALIERGVIADFRAPDLLRLGFSPLYLSHRDILDATDILEDILTRGTWHDPRFRERNPVT
ncbi:MAG: kynureninase [Pseudohongiellaceae bacterium]